MIPVSLSMKINFICPLHCIINLSFSRWRSKEKQAKKKRNLRGIGTPERVQPGTQAPIPQEAAFIIRRFLSLVQVITFSVFSAHLRKEMCPWRARPEDIFWIGSSDSNSQEIFALIRHAMLLQLFQRGKKEQR